MSTVVIRYDGTDITSKVMLSECSFVSVARGTPGTCQFTVKELTATLDDFIVGKSLVLEIDGTREWAGYVTSVGRKFFFPVDDPDCEGLVPRGLVVTGTDNNILLSKRVIYDKNNLTNLALSIFPPGSSDQTVIKHYFQTHSDLPADGVLTDKVQAVSTPTFDDDIAGHASWTFNEFLYYISTHIGSIWYMDPNKQLIYCDVDTPTAPFGISDRPGAGEIGCQSFELTLDGTRLRNDVLVWGAGQGEDEMVFRRLQDAPSIAAHGRWQEAQFNHGVWKQTTVDKIANYFVYGSPQNKRGGKDDAPAIRCRIFTPGFQVAQKVLVRLEVHDFVDAIPIRQMTITFASPTEPIWDLVMSHEIDNPYSTFDPLPPFVIDPPVFENPPFPSNPCDPPGGDGSVIFGIGATPIPSQFPRSQSITQHQIFANNRDSPSPAAWWFTDLQPALTWGLHFGGDTISGGWVTSPTIGFQWGRGFADVVFHSGAFRTPTGQVIEGPAINPQGQFFKTYRAPENTVIPGGPITVVMDGRIRFVGVQNERPQYPDVPGFSTGLEWEALPPQTVAVYVLREGDISTVPNVNVIPTELGFSSNNLAGDPVWSGVLQPASGSDSAMDWVPIHIQFNVLSGQHYALTANVLEQSHTKSIVWSSSATTPASVVFQPKEGMPRYILNLPAGAGVLRGGGGDITCGVADTFTRVVSAGWGTSDSGHPWTSVSTMTSVDGTKGVMTHVNSGGTWQVVNVALGTDLGQPNAYLNFWSDPQYLEGTFDFTLQNPLPALGRLSVLFHNLCGTGSGDDGNSVSFVFGTSETIDLRARRIRTCDLTSSGTVTTGSFSWAAGATYSARVMHDGLSTNLKVWLKGDPEPSTWTLSAIPSPAPTGIFIPHWKFQMPQQTVSATAGSVVQIDNFCIVSPDCSVTSGIADPPVGWTCENLTRIDTPSGQDPTSAYYATTAAFSEAGEDELWVDGIFIPPNKYTRNGDDAWIGIHSVVDVGDENDPQNPPKTIRLCYIATPYWDEEV